jgi:hypothetical protein
VLATDTSNWYSYRCYKNPFQVRVILDFLSKRLYNKHINSNKEQKMEDFITVADMIEALRALPADARLVMTESGYYCYGELASVCMPEAYTMEDDEGGLSVGEVVYRIGHSHQSY